MGSLQWRDPFEPFDRDGIPRKHAEQILRRQNSMYAGNIRLGERFTVVDRPMIDMNMAMMGMPPPMSTFTDNQTTYEFTGRSYSRWERLGGRIPGTPDHQVWTASQIKAVWEGNSQTVPAPKPKPPEKFPKHVRHQFLKNRLKNRKNI